MVNKYTNYIYKSYIHFQTNDVCKRKKRNNILKESNFFFRRILSPKFFLNTILNNLNFTILATILKLSYPHLFDYTNLLTTKKRPSVQNTCISSAGVYVVLSNQR